MMRAHVRKLMRLISTSLLSFLLLVPMVLPVFAEPIPRLPDEETPDALYGSFLDSIYKTANKSGYQTGTGTTLGEVITSVTQTFIGLLGVISVFLIIYAGYLWMTAGGDDSKIEKSKNIIKQVIVGFIVLSLAYGIIAYVFYAITIAGSGEVK